MCIFAKQNKVFSTKDKFSIIMFSIKNILDFKTFSIKYKNK